MDAILSLPSKILHWLADTGSPSQVLLGVVFSFNTGLALLKKFKEELNARLLSAVKEEIETARNAGWLGDLSIIDKISSASFRCVVRSLVIERDRLESGEYPFVVWSARTARSLMLACAMASLVCMAWPCTARWTALLIIPYPTYVAVSKLYERCKAKAFNDMRKKVKEEYDMLPNDDKKMISKNKISDKDIAKKLKGATRKPSAK